MVIEISDFNMIREILSGRGPDEDLFEEADRTRRKNYGDAVYLRGLIELTNYCKNNCYYCGIRAGNSGLMRYRLDKESILRCCREGYSLGFRTFVLQGGEDPYYEGDEGDLRLCEIVSEIRENHPDCAITLSVGERPRESYQKLFDAGANRYLLRHEAASEDLYRSLHPAEMRLENRKRCLYDLKEIGYQVGTGIMVGVPGQTTDDLLDDLRFMQSLQPDMIGIGPYLRHRDTPFGKSSVICAKEPAKDEKTQLTLRLLAILRLMFPYALIPSTTALGTIDPKGRIMGLKVGANVVMPNLTPAEWRDHYTLYDNKLSVGAEAAQGRALLEEQVKAAGYRIVTDIGDVKR